jgi:hypothetical protein
MGVIRSIWKERETRNLGGIELTNEVVKKAIPSLAAIMMCRYTEV